MRSLLASLLLAALTAGCAQAQPAATAGAINVTPIADRPASVGPSDSFTGTALISPLFDPAGARDLGAAGVTFLPGARTHWHSHPAGQTLVVTEGVGWVQARGGEPSGARKRPGHSAMAPAGR